MGEDGLANAAIDDCFRTIAITWSQSEAAVMLSMFAFYEVPALAVGQHVTRTLPNLAVAFQGIQIRVHHDWWAEACDLLADVATRPAAIRPRLIDNRWANGCATVLLCLLGLMPPPPTRTASTFLLDRA
jgi:hypothetical protein